jgi:hypothetical protein
MRIDRILLLALAALTSACGAANLTASEAKEAVDEASYDSQASALTSNTIEVSTNFTLGQGIQNAAQQLRSFMTAELPCASVTQQDGTLTVEYGATGGQCVYRGHTITGKHTIKLTKVDAETAQVEHTWTDLSNGKVKVNGTATVTWNKTDKTRHVQHQLSILRIAKGVTVTSSGDRTQRPLDGGITEGIQVDGSRNWTNAKGEWDLAINSVQMRWKDPIPFSGSYELTTPKGATVTISFERIDDATIRATLVTPRRTYTFKVRSSGDAEDETTTET